MGKWERGKQRTATDQPTQTQIQRLNRAREMEQMWHDSEVRWMTNDQERDNEQMRTTSQWARTTHDTWDCKMHRIHDFIHQKQQGSTTGRSTPPGASESEKRPTQDHGSQYTWTKTSWQGKDQTSRTRGQPNNSSANSDSPPVSDSHASRSRHPTCNYPDSPLSKNFDRY